MATFKLTTLFQYTSAISSPNAPVHRTAGFSESIYANAASAPAVVNAAQGTPAFVNQPGLWPARAALLPVGTSIIGYRVQQVSPTGPSQAGSINYPGVVGQLADLPMTALLCKSPSLSTGNIRRFTLRGVPDVQVVEGEAQFSAGFQAALIQYFNCMAGWFFRGRDLSQTAVKIVSIAVVAGVATVTTETNITFAVNDMVRILRTLDSGKNLRGGRFQVASVGPGSNVFTISNWTFGNTTGGSARKDAVVFAPVDFLNTSFGRVVSRRVGRPFVGYRGRRAKRR